MLQQKKLERPPTLLLASLEVRFTDNPSQEEVGDANFNISYGPGEWLNGRLVYDQVSFAGVKFPKQEISIVTSVRISPRQRRLI